jgi:hypothetical protein
LVIAFKVDLDCPILDKPEKLQVIPAVAGFQIRPPSARFIAHDVSQNHFFAVKCTKIISKELIPDIFS